MDLYEIYKNGYLISQNIYFDFKNFNQAKEIILLESKKDDLILIIEDKSLESTISIIGSLISSRSTLLIDLSIARFQLNEIISKFKPSLILGSKYSFEFLELEINFDTKYFLIKKIKQNPKNKPIPEPLLLLGTSGSSGNTKFVGLTHKNIYNNCESITSYLENDSSSVSINNLPCSYSYGLSVLNTTLFKGGKYVISKEKSFLRNEFWEDAKNHNLTDFSGVPTTYKTLIKLNIKKILPKTIKRLTQAGGKLEVDIQKELLNLSNKLNFDLFIMYGQTEATARLCYLNLTKEPHKIGTVGRVIKNVELISSKMSSFSESELIFSGPNISLGYFNSYADFYGEFDQNRGVLKTGDLGVIDTDNCITITGRKSRFCKIDGIRISLELIELRLLKEFPNVAVVSNDEKIFIVIKGLKKAQMNEIRKDISLHCGINKIRISLIDTDIPLTNNGKVSYAKLLENILLLVK